MNRIVTTADGSHTIYARELNEHYHSIHGAVQESEFIFIKNGFDLCPADPLYIFEAGFGTGLNALLTAARAANDRKIVYYTTFEKYPLDPAMTGSLNHQYYAGDKGPEIFKKLHSAGWGIMSKINNWFNLLKIKGDLTSDEIHGFYDLIYFDAFGPDKQPEMWTKKVLEKIAEITKPGGIFVTYSAKGEVKRILKSCGFTVTLTDGPPGKRHIIRAIKS